MLEESCNNGGLLQARIQMRTLLWQVSPETDSGSCSVTASGLSSARRHGALLLRLRRPPGYGFHLWWTHRKCRAWHLGAGASRLAPPGVTRARSGIQKRRHHHVPISYVELGRF